MRITIERLRTLVLVSGGLLIVALIAFLVLGRWKRHFLVREIPKRLGVDIKQEANGVTYTQARGGHTLFKIHASKVVQLKKDGRALLHDVQIELYGEDGNRVDRISGNEFEYDQKAGTASAAGPVEIAITRPRVAPALVPNATPGRAMGKAATPLANMAQGAAEGQIDVKTSGLTFDQKSGRAVTAQRVEFSTVQGNGSSMGATFDSEAGRLILEHAVELNVRRGRDIAVLRAQHAELERSALTCSLRGATVGYRGADVTAGQAQLLFRQDGSMERLGARGGFTLASESGTHVKAPTGVLDFNEKNVPMRGRLEGGVEMESVHAGQQMRGSAPAADLSFTGQGELRSAHLERGVWIHTEQQAQGRGGPVHVVRDWRSPVLDLAFKHSYANKAELASIHGTGGVVATGLVQQLNGPAVPSRMAADVVTGDFGDGQQLTRLVGEGHATMEQTTRLGAHQTSFGDRLEASFMPASRQAATETAGKQDAGLNGIESQVEWAKIEGNVVVTQQGISRPGGAAQSFRATAAHALYEGADEMVHLSGSPRVEDAGFQLAAERIDLSHASGDVSAHGNVKATWLNSAKTNAPGQIAVTMGGQGPVHVVSKEAQFRQATGEATFRGQVRMWQEANSIVAPTIVLNRLRQTLVARGNGTGEPVDLVLLSSANATKPLKSDHPAVVRLRAGELKYSDGERKAVLNGGSLGAVVADTGNATISSGQVELLLLPAGSHPGEGAAQVDKLTARGHVAVTSGTRRGTGELLVYSSQSAEYTLTGTAGASPRFTDPAHGTVTGAALIFNSRDDSVRIEGDGRRTTTETTVSR